MTAPARQAYYKLAAALLILLALAAFFWFELYRYISLERLKDYQAVLSELYAENPVLTIGAYVGAYTAIAAFSLPAIVILSIAGGAIFGLAAGTVAASFSSAAGATITFLAARFLFRDYVQKRYAKSLATANREVAKNGGLYLLTMRMVQVIPSFFVNILMALTPIKTSLFFIVTQIGMLPGIFVYVNAGTQLASIESIDDILSFNLIASLALIGALPWIGKGMAATLRKVKARKNGT
ncbi:MAG: VTT domain-containing protein [Desulfosalsimonadaceae bacterium]